jgi:hypothetical protein
MHFPILQRVVGASVSQPEKVRSPDGDYIGDVLPATTSVDVVPLATVARLLDLTAVTVVAELIHRAWRDGAGGRHPEEFGVHLGRSSARGEGARLACHLKRSAAVRARHIISTAK